MNARDMNVGAIVFSRMSSSRLPGKALLPIGEQPLLGWVLQRAGRARGVSQVVVATSTDPSDDPVEQFVRGAGARVYRGPLDNVAARALGCAREFGFTAFARVCGDRLFLAPEDIDLSIRRMIETNGDLPVDLVTNTLAGPVPAGLTTEIVRTDALADALASTSDARDLEHVTRYFYGHADRFRIVTGAEVPAALQGVRLVVDTMEDLQRARYIVDRLDDPATAPLGEIANLARTWEEQRHDQRAHG
jgi:spore coat polysaccharide biosynthesis protein SpsF (cytidylyltransferase family)